MDINASENNSRILSHLLIKFAMLHESMASMVMPGHPLGPTP